MSAECFDLIGDLHGEAGMLRALLEQMGYRRSHGAYRHPSRRVIFLGDYVDRGPAIRDTLHLIREMVEAGSALALMGNHEWNALLHESRDPSGQPLRPNGGAVTAMMTRTLADFADHPQEWQEWLQWIRELPLYLDLPGLRAVHAYWQPTAFVHLPPGEPHDAAWLLRAAQRPSTLNSAVDIILKGPEVPLPPGITVRGAGTHRYDHVRIAWWLDGRGQTYRDVCVHRHELPPETLIPEQFLPLFSPAAQDHRPVFFGHYWMPPGIPEPLTAKCACLDYSAVVGGPLVAYRWDGEQTLSAEKFTWIEGRGTAPSAPSSAVLTSV